MMRRFRKRKNTTIVNLSEKELKAIEKNFDPNLAEKFMKKYNKQGMSPYPIPFTYRGGFSINGKSSKDLLLSHTNGLIGKDNGNMARLPTPNQRVLVFAPSDNHIQVFCCTVKKFTKDEDDVMLWKDNGGKVWSYNYKVEINSDIKTYSYKDFDKLTSQRVKVLSTIFQPRNTGTRIEQVGKDRNKIWWDIMRTHGYFNKTDKI
tara:strand:+ start:1055 stop:1666 length:612 start_codon:yes stop_codon:yes gene_type:complete